MTAPSNNPYRRHGKRWWEREAHIEEAKKIDLIKRNGRLREALAELSRFAESIIPECACGCHAVDDHCDNCCWPPRNGICPDCITYMREPMPG